MSMVQCPECKGEVSDKAYACPHCGYPIREVDTEQYEYVLSKGESSESSISGLLRVLAFLVWIGGLIIAVAGANVADSLYSSHFSFAAFLTIMIPYLIYGFILWGMATLADQIANTSSIVSGLKLEKRLQKKDTSVSRSKSNYESKVSSANSYVPKPKSNEWICPACHFSNRTWEDTCAMCGEPRKR